jgi:hypothetical protein
MLICLRFSRGDLPEIPNARIVESAPAAFTAVEATTPASCLPPGDPVPPGLLAHGVPENKVETRTVVFRVAL